MTYKTALRWFKYFENAKIEALLEEYETSVGKTRWQLKVRGYTGRMLTIRRTQDASRVLHLHGAQVGGTVQQ